ncbi:hypothetical protein PI124_g21710 [Phytophthora idaei]|nr:hypothetical protein PI125_g23753 [Phytophthora idaei]KAG3233211.1 hypothetical protein PI124_g21710 [Phytophthora idaei]
MATYVLKKPVASVTDDDIMSAVVARCRTRKNEFVPDVTFLFRQKLKMDLSIGAGNESEAGYKSRLKARCRLLVENLQPPVLKAQINRLIDLERRDCKSDDVVLFDLILEHAKVRQRFHRMSQDYAVKSDIKPGKSDRKSHKTGNAKPEPARAASPAASAPAWTRTQRYPRPLPQEACLVCKGAHWLKDCPTATSA